MAKRVIIGGAGGGRGFGGGGGGGGFGVSAFTQLSDVPHSYSGQARKIPSVKATEDGIEFLPLDLSEFLGVVANQAAMLALTGDTGDWCIRSDLSTTWIITANNGHLITDWTQIAYPAQPYKVLAYSDDTSPDYLGNKLAPYPETAITINNGESDESVLIGIEVDNVTIQQDVNELTLRATDRPVISIYDNTSGLPSSPANHDRYIAKVTAHGWTMNHIYEWNSISWYDFTPYRGMRVYNTDTANFWYFQALPIVFSWFQELPYPQIQTVNNPTDEAAAFAAGAMIVIRSDLL